MRSLSPHLAVAAFLVLMSGGALAQAAGSIQGHVVDPNGAAIPNATVEILNPVSQYTHTVATDATGKFGFDNVPYNNYHMVVAANGFKSAQQDVTVATPVPVNTTVHLELGAASQVVTVTSAGDLVETDSATHTDIDRDMFEKVPLESSTSGLSSLITLAAPGVVADSNGLFHGLGDHAENSFSVDGQPITDQQSKVFSNQLPVDAVQSMQVIEGAPPAEYGERTSLVAVVTTRSGLGATRAHGDLSLGYGSFDTPTLDGDVSLGGRTWGEFAAVSGMNTQRFLDTPEFAILHDNGNQGNIFDRFDDQPSLSNTFSVNLQLTRSWFQTPNSYDAENATAWNGLVANNGGLGPNGLAVGAQDQRSEIFTVDFAPTWTHVIDATSSFSLGVWARQDGYHYYPSGNPFADLTPDLQSESIGQDRKLTDLGARASYAKVTRHHNFKIGAESDSELLFENDTLALVNPALNAVCNDAASGSPDTSPSLTSASQCTGALTPNPGFVPTLACIDLTRTAALPASDGCGATQAGAHPFFGRADIRDQSFYGEDTITAGKWTANLGLREDMYDGITRENLLQPRAGLSYNIAKTGSVLRVSYARTEEVPFNENLVLASEGCSDPEVSALMAAVQGYPCLSAPETPGVRNEYHAGLTQAFGRYLVFDGEYIWKYTDRAYDFSVLGNSPITFPIEWDKSKIPGFAFRWTMPQWHGLSAFVTQAHVEARFFTPQVSGIGVTPTSDNASSVFRIDHDENYEQTTHLQYQIGKKGPWVGFNWRYDSGLVAGPVPCAGGNCVNGPGGGDATIDVSGLSPDEQFEAGLYCGATYATPTTPISPNGLCPAGQYGSKYISIPAPGTENDDHNPPRIKAHNLFDFALGEDHLYTTDRFTLSGQLTVVNALDTEALFNFLSTFSGTHYITPRNAAFTLGVHF